MKSDYYKSQYNVGVEFEQFVVDQLRRVGLTVDRVEGFESQLRYGDTTIGLEIKFDQQLEKTGNLFIETRERTTTHKAWVESGIYRRDATTWYGIGDKRRFWIFRKTDLCEYWEQHPYAQFQARAERAHDTGQGFVMSSRQATWRLAFARYDWADLCSGHPVAVWPGARPCAQYFGVRIVDVPHDLNEWSRLVAKMNAYEGAK